MVRLLELDATGRWTCRGIMPTVMSGVHCTMVLGSGARPWRLQPAALPVHLIHSLQRLHRETASPVSRTNRDTGTVTHAPHRDTTSSVAFGRFSARKYEFLHRNHPVEHAVHHETRLRDLAELREPLAIHPLPRAERRDLGLGDLRARDRLAVLLPRHEPCNERLARLLTRLARREEESHQLLQAPGCSDPRAPA